MVLGKRTIRKLARAERRVAKRVRRMIGRPKMKSRNMRSRPTQATLYRYTRFSGTSTTQTVDTTEFDGYAIFSLDDVKSYTDFTSLYDQFMISHAQVQFTLITNPNAAYPINGTLTSSTINPSNWFPKIWWVYDSDDANTISLSAMKERQGVKCLSLQPDRAIVLNVKPKVLVQTYRTATTTGYAPKRMFLDCATGYNVPHYGLKYVIDTMGLDPSDTYPFKVRVEIKYWLKFKGVL